VNVFTSLFGALDTVLDNYVNEAVVAATGSELQLAVAARRVLLGEGRKLNVVSIPCLEIFLAQGGSYRERLFPRGVPVVTIEAGRTGERP